ncbi:MAG: glycosyltransferase family 2 protein [Patescibacteria group bacterium]
MKLSVAIATYNEEKKLDACLASIVSWTDEIVLVDGGSVDRTLETAAKYKARIIQTDNPPIFHINKQKALEACKGDWILQLDADEVVTPELAKEIRQITDNRQQITDKGYFIPRKNFFCGRWLSKGGQYPDYLIRLIRRGSAHFPCKSVHEQIVVDGKVGHLNNPLLHYPYGSIGDYWRKANAYISLTAQEYKEKKLPLNLLTYVEYNFFKPVVTFFSIFMRHKGFVDGYWGFLFALFSALHHPLAYMRYIKNQQRS